MKKFLFILLMWGNVALAQSPIITQTYTDRCTGGTFVFSVPSNGQTVVVFYSKSRVFTANEFTNGALRAWLEETYNWWRNLNPCSTTQASATVAQQTAQQAASTATSIATNIPMPPPMPAPMPAPMPPPPPPPTPSTPAPPPPPSNSGSSSSSPPPQEKSGGEAGKGGGEGEKKGGGPEEKKGGSSEEKKEGGSEEKSESESSDSEESSSEEKKEEKKDEKKKVTTPPIIAANMAGIQGLDGKVATALSFGLSKSSLLGDKSYGVNSMVWSNMKQFLVSGNYSKTHIVNGEVDMISSTSVGATKMYSTYLFSVGHSKVFLGRDGSVFGFNFGNNITSTEVSDTERELSGSFNTVFFYTKSFNFTRLSLAPLIALASNLVTYNFSTKTMDMPHFHILLTGNNFNYTVTKRFGANLGIIATSSLSNEFPTTYAITVGSRFQF
jgi:hypothetical protein